VPYTAPFEGFKLAYDRRGSGPPVVMLHGWPGDRTDYEALAPLVADFADVITPDLRGFGESDKHRADPEESYSPQAQARAIAALMEELGVSKAVLAGYDVGSLVAQTVAATRPELVKALVVSPPLPGGGGRVLQITPVREFWYTSFHQLDLIEHILDGNPDGIRYYLQHFWNHWSGPDYTVGDDRLDHLTQMYSQPGAFVAAAQWYRSSGNPVTAYVAETKPPPADRLTTPTTILWQEHDAIFPQAWSDRLSDFFTDYTYTELPGVGHFTPLEAADKFAEAIRHASDPD
jgi:pimeloyl-ACP methyl ester carboxylesterase